MPPRPCHSRRRPLVTTPTATVDRAAMTAAHAGTTARRTAAAPTRGCARPRTPRPQPAATADSRPEPRRPPGASDRAGPWTASRPRTAPRRPTAASVGACRGPVGIGGRRGRGRSWLRRRGTSRARGRRSVSRGPRRRPAHPRDPDGPPRLRCPGRGRRRRDEPPQRRCPGRRSRRARRAHRPQGRAPLRAPAPRQPHALEGDGGVDPRPRRCRGLPRPS